MNSSQGQEDPTSPSESELGAGESIESLEGYGDSEESAYDPASALVDENQSYGAAQSFDPNQVYYDEQGRAYYFDEQGQAYYFPEPEPEPQPVAEGEAGDASPPPTADYSVYDEAPPAPTTPPQRSAPEQKKVVHRAPQRKPSTTGRRPAPKPVVYGGGISPITVLLTLVALGMLAVVVLVAMPKDLSAVGGHAVGLTDGAKPRNLLAETQKIMIDRNSALTFSEEEVNRYLNHRLSGSQKGMMAALVKFRGIYIDFSPSKAEVILEREIFGRAITMSVDLSAEEFRRQIVYKPTAWHIGKISLGSRTVAPVVALFVRLRDSLVDEYQVLQQMPNVRFEDNKVVLDPRI